MSHNRSDVENVAEIIRDAGGEIVGRTRLQKIVYLLEITGLGSGFLFEYRHYGPFSEDLANAVAEAGYLDLITEEEHSTWWGGSYSVFKSATPSSSSSTPCVARKRILSFGVRANPISLELAATAAYLAREGYQDAWAETSRRKPEKAQKELASAKALYAKLQSLDTPTPMPAI